MNELKCKASANRKREYELVPITQTEQWLALKPAWEALLAAQTHKNFFMSFEWHFTWWITLGGEKSHLYILTVRKRNSTVAILPLMLVKATVARFPYLQARMLTTIERPYTPRSFSGSLDALVMPGHEHCLIYLWKFLLSEHQIWQILRLFPIPQGSPLIQNLDALPTASRASVNRQIIFHNACLRIDGAWEDYFRTRSRRLRENVKRAQRHLQQIGEIKIAEYRHPETVNRAWKEILFIESHAWKWRSGIRINDSSFRDFYLRLAQQIARRGWLRIMVLKINSTPIAFDYHVDYHGHIKTLKGSYHQDYARYSPGMLLTWYALQRFFDEGAKEVDFLWGNLDYKQKWTNSLQPQWEIVICKDHPYAKWIHFLRESPFVQNALKKYRRLERRFLISSSSDNGEETQ